MAKMCPRWLMDDSSPAGFALVVLILPHDAPGVIHRRCGSEEVADRREVRIALSDSGRVVL